MRNSFGVLNIYFKALRMIGLVLGILGFAVGFTWLALPAVEALWLGPLRWFFTTLVIFFVIFLWLLTGLIFYFHVLGAEAWDVWRDVFGRAHTLRGHVSRKWDTVESDGEHTWIAVSRLPFEVCRPLHDCLSQGDEVVVHYRPRSKTVARVEKLSD